MIAPTNHCERPVRAIVFLLFIILVFLILRFTLNRVIEIRAKNREKAMMKDRPASAQESQPMVRCALCGIHLPQSEAYFDGQHTFCSEGHMREFHENGGVPRKTGKPAQPDEANSHSPDDAKNDD